MKVDECRYIRDENLVERKIRDEHLLVPVCRDLETLDSVFALNPAASLLWERTEAGASLAELADRLMEVFEVDRDRAEADVQEWLTELTGIGALRK
ncbi:MAG: PqqD family protein, partial [Verrucomicrobiota bacterium]